MAAPAQIAPARGKLRVEDLGDVVRVFLRIGADAVERAGVAGAEQPARSAFLCARIESERQHLALGKIERRDDGAVGADEIDAAVGAGGRPDVAVAVDVQRGEVAVGERVQLLDAPVGVDAIDGAAPLAIARQARVGRPASSSGVVGMTILVPRGAFGPVEEVVVVVLPLRWNSLTAT